MAKCKDCLHYEPCSAFSEIINAAVDVEKGCEHFKDRTEVAEVVRCKDCRHFVTPQGVPCCDNFFGLGFPHPSGDDFCAYGERREGE